MCGTRLPWEDGYFGDARSDSANEHVLLYWLPIGCLSRNTFKEVDSHYVFNGEGPKSLGENHSLPVG